MILNRNFYTKVSWFRAFWNIRQADKLVGEKVFKMFKLHKTEWPEKIYFYSPRLKRVPKFTGAVELLKQWTEAKKCEELCPTRAITVTQKDFIIDPKGCIACGLCVELAPEGILEMSADMPVMKKE